MVRACVSARLVAGPPITARRETRTAHPPCSPAQVVVLALPLLLVSTRSSAQTLTMQECQQPQSISALHVTTTHEHVILRLGEKRVDPKLLRPRVGRLPHFTDQWAKAGQVGGHEFGFSPPSTMMDPIWPSKATPPSSSPSAVPYTSRRVRSDHGLSQVLRRFFPRPGARPNLYFSIWLPTMALGRGGTHNGPRRGRLECGRAPT